MEFMILIKYTNLWPLKIQRPLSLKICVNQRRREGRFALIIASRGVVAAPKYLFRAVGVIITSERRANRDGYGWCVYIDGCVWMWGRGWSNWEICMLVVGGDSRGKGAMWQSSWLRHGYELLWRWKWRERMLILADLTTRGIKMKICTLGSDFHTSVQKGPFYTLVWKIGGQCAKKFAHWPPCTLGLHGQLSEWVCKICAHNPFIFCTLAFAHQGCKRSYSSHTIPR